MDLSRYLAIIPARAGSKRLPGKNFRDFCGKPLWQWAVECAREAGFILDEIAISSDMEIPGSDSDWYYGNREIPCLIPHGCMWIRRPAFLCRDESSTWDAVEHVCYTLEHFGPVVVLQPTSPLRTAAQVLAVIERFEELGEFEAIATRTEIGLPNNGGVYVCGWKHWMEITKHLDLDTGPDIDTQEDWDRAEAMMRDRLQLDHAAEAGP